MTFNWNAPARLNVRESTRIQGKDVKLKYDLMVEPLEQLEGYLILSFANVTLIEFDGEQVNLSTYPARIRQPIKRLLVDFYSRPSIIVSPAGRIAAFTDVDKSTRARFAITQPVDSEAQPPGDEEVVAEPGVLAQMQASSDSVWSCVVRPWLDFSTPVNERSEQSVSLYIFEGAEPAPAVRIETNNGFSADSVVELESVTVSSGVELAQVMLRAARLAAGESMDMPDIEGVVTATNRRTAKARLDPDSLKPHWARCDIELTIDSNDDSIMPSANRSQTTEFEIQWL